MSFMIQSFAADALYKFFMAMTQTHVGHLVLVLIGTYFAISILAYVNLLSCKEKWLPEFRKEMKTISFKIILLFYLPISITRNLFWPDNGKEKNVL